MKNINLPSVPNVDVPAVAKVIKSLATALSDMKNTKSLKFSLQRITVDNQIHTYGAELLKSGAQIFDEIVVPFYENAKEYKPYILDCLEKGYTQKKIAELINLSQSTVSRVINGK